MCTSAEGDCGNLAVVHAARDRGARARVEEIISRVGQPGHCDRVARLREFLAVPNNGALTAQVRELLASQPTVLRHFEEAVEEAAFSRRE